MLKLERKYEGKSFMYDGIEEVKLFRIIDADSSFFQTSSGNLNIRYYGINAPETTKKIEPLGKEAREYAKSKLLKARRIVIESDDVVPEKDNTGKRFLAYIWVQEKEDEDFYLYNELILKDGFAALLLFDNVTKYKDAFIEANNEAKIKGINLYDKDLDTSNFKISDEYTLKEILDKIDEYSDGRTIKTKGVISAKVGSSFFIQEKIDDKYIGTYVYNTKYDISGLNKGDLISFSCQASFDETYGKQLINIRGVEVLSKDNIIEIKTVETIEEIMNNIGLVVRVEDVRIFQKANCNKKYNSYYLRLILPFGEMLSAKVFRDTINAPSFASIIQNKYYSFIGGLTLYNSNPEEGFIPWLVLCDDSKITTKKIDILE